MNYVEFKWICWTCLLIEVYTEVPSFCLHEFKFLYRLTFNQFQQSYTAFKYLSLYLMKRHYEHVWWARLTHMVFKFWSLWAQASNFVKLCLVWPKLLSLELLMSIANEQACCMGLYKLSVWAQVGSLNLVIALASLDPINIIVAFELLSICQCETENIMRYWKWTFVLGSHCWRDDYTSVEKFWILLLL